MSARRRAIVAGALVGLAATLLFGAVHALIIVPIWWRLLSGIPFALVTGAAAGWAWNALHTDDSPTIADALRYGALLWLTLLPTTLLGIALRASGFHAAHDNWETLVEALVAASTGALAAWSLTHRRSPTLSLAAATATLVLTMGGPLPVMNGRRPILLYLSFLPILIAPSLLLYLGLRRLPRE